MIKKLSLILLLAGAQMQAVIDINGKGVNKQALFIGACSTGNHELAKLLIEAGVNVNHETADGMTPLMLAAQNNDINMIKLLLNTGANLTTICKSNGINSGMVALDFTHNTEIIRLLTSAGAKVTGKNDNKQSLMKAACEQGNYELAKILIQAGVNINQYDSNTEFSPLIIATRRNDIEMVKILLNAGANVNYVPPRQLGSLCALDMAHNTEIVKLLINAGADVNHKFWHGQCTSLSLAIGSSLEKVKLLINAGAEIDVEFSDGLGLNNMQRGIAGIVSYGTERGEDACRMIDYLISLGLDVNAKYEERKNNHNTLLQTCVEWNCIQVVKFLLSLPQTDIKKINYFGKTAFDIAVENKRLEIIELFQNYFAAQEAKALRGNEQQATNKSVINIANNSNGQLNVLHQVEVPAHSKAEVTTVISKI